jgi:hypothetical protein
MAPIKHVIRGLVVVSAAAVLAVLITAHPAVPLSALAASSLHGARSDVSQSYYDSRKDQSYSYSSSQSSGSSCTYSCESVSPSQRRSPGNGSSGSNSSSESNSGSLGPNVAEGFPVGPVGGSVAVLLLLLLLWALASRRRKVRRDVRWVRERLRAVADPAPGLPSAEIRHRPGGRSVSLAFEPHLPGDQN